MVISILCLLIQASMFSQVDLKNYSYQDVNSKFTLRVIQYEFDTTIIDFGKGRKQVMLSPNKIVWGLHSSLNDSLIYSFNHLSLYDKEVLISQNGKNIVLLNQKVSNLERVKSIVVLEFFSNGVLSMQYRLKDINVSKKQMVNLNEEGVWCFSDFQIINDSVFKVNTIGFKSILFNMSTGKNLSKEYMRGVDESSHILYGVVDRVDVNKDLYTIYVDDIIQSQKLKGYDYQFQSSIDFNGAFTLVVINDGKCEIAISEF